MDVRYDFISEFGAEDGSRFLLLLERRPKWLLLLLYLRKKVRLSIKEAMELLGLSHTSLKKAIRYLSGRPDMDAKRSFIASTIYRPLISIEMLSYNEKFIILTEYGREFADKIIWFLKKIALNYGRIDVENELGIPLIEVRKYIRRKLGGLGVTDYDAYDERIIDWQRLVRRLSVKHPLLLRIMNTEVIDAIPVELWTPSKKYILYVVL